MYTTTFKLEECNEKAIVVAVSLLLLVVLSACGGTETELVETRVDATYDTASNRTSFVLSSEGSKVESLSIMANGFHVLDLDTTSYASGKALDVTAIGCTRISSNVDGNFGTFVFSCAVDKE